VIQLLTTDYPPLDWKHSQPGYLGLVVVLVLFVGAGLLFRSFLKHARKAREPWEGDESPTSDTADGS
jgi:hypothetical protein